MTDESETENMPRALGKAALIFLPALLAFDSAAQACSCLGPHGEMQKREFAVEMAKNAVAVVEAVEIEPMDLAEARPELYRVTRVHVGQVPATFRGARTFRRFGGLVDVEITTCDAEPGADEPRLIALYRPEDDAGAAPIPAGACGRAGSPSRAEASQPVFAIGSMCAYLFLTSDGVLDLVKEEARRLGRRNPGEAMMAETKTKPTAVSVDDFIAAVEKPVRRADALVVRDLMERVTGEKATMWGPSIIGFGTYHYRYDSGHEGDMCRTGFSPRSANLVLYVGGFPEYEALLERLGKHKRSKACLYVNKLADVELDVLEEIVRRTHAATEGADHCPVC